MNARVIYKDSKMIVHANMDENRIKSPSGETHPLASSICRNVGDIPVEKRRTTIKVKIRATARTT